MSRRVRKEPKLRRLLFLICTECTGAHTRMKKEILPLLRIHTVHTLRLATVCRPISSAKKIFCIIRSVIPMNSVIMSAMIMLKHTFKEDLMPENESAMS